MFLPTLLAVWSASAPLAWSSTDGLAAVRGVLQRTEGSTRAPDSVLVRRLVALGPDRTAALFSLVSGVGLEDLFGETDEALWLCPPERVAVLALEALAEFPRVGLLEFLHGATRPPSSREARAAALALLGQVASADGLELYLDLCVQSGEELELRSLRATALEALERTLRQDPATLPRLETQLPTAPESLKLLACEALGSVPRPASATLLAQFLGQSPALDAAILEALARLGADYPWLMAESVASRLRATLKRGSPALQVLAARALGRVRDCWAVPDLIACLAGTDATLARAAEWALREISLRPELRGQAAWQQWLGEERRWWEERGLGLVASLEQGVSSGALREFLRHPLAREELAVALAAGLAELEPAAQCLVIEVLAKLAAKGAVPALVERLYESDADIRAAAWAALRRLTGRDLPAEPRLWDDYASGA